MNIKRSTVNKIKTQSKSILIIAILLSSILMIFGVYTKCELEHDESISYLASSGHQKEYSTIKNSHLYGKVVSVNQWKKYLKVEKPFCFNKISHDLSHYDIHPPLYFWLLHIWTLIFGIKLWTGPILNILLSLATLIILFKFSKALLKNPFQAALVSLMWAISPSVIVIPLVARPYNLLALISTLYIWQYYKCLMVPGKTSVKNLIILVLYIILGTLTHYYFLIILFGSWLAAYLTIINIDTIKKIKFNVSLLLGLLAVVLIHPQFYLSFIRQQSQKLPADISNLPDRILNIILAVLNFFIKVERGTKQYLLTLLLIGLLILFALLYVLLKNKKTNSSMTFNNLNPEFNFIFYFLFITFSASILLYVTFQIHQNAIGPRYLCMVWPFLALISVLIFNDFNKHKIKLIFIYIIISLSSIGTLHQRYIQFFEHKSYALNKNMHLSNLIVIDNIKRGVLLPIIHTIPNNKNVFCG